MVATSVSFAAAAQLHRAPHDRCASMQRGGGRGPGRPQLLASCSNDGLVKLWDCETLLHAVGCANTPPIVHTGGVCWRGRSSGRRSLPTKRWGCGPHSPGFREQQTRQRRLHAPQNARIFDALLPLARQRLWWQSGPLQTPRSAQLSRNHGRKSCLPHDQRCGISDGGRGIASCCS